MDAMSKWVALHGEPLFADPENAHQYNIDYSASFWMQNHDHS
ncbi:hypothetical protein O9992_25070 [Vibrio lentus]|nr:hypothetical protein [Vibrio lentus]